MNKQTVVNGTLSNEKEQNAAACNITDESQSHYAEGKLLISKHVNRTPFTRLSQVKSTVIESLEAVVSS